MRLPALTLIGLMASLLTLSVAPLSAQSRETILHATTLEKSRAPVRSARTASWPSIGRQISLSLNERQGDWDGMPMSYAEFKGRSLDLELRFSDLEYWTRVEPTRGRYSLEFAFQWNPTVILGVSAFPRSRPFDDLSDENWQAYIASLATLPDCLIHVDDDSQRNGQMLVIMGGRTRVINYTTVDETTETPYRFIQVWVELKNSIFVVSIEGPDAAVTQATTAFDSVVRSFSFTE